MGNIMKFFHFFKFTLCLFFPVRFFYADESGSPSVVANDIALAGGKRKEAFSLL